MIIYIQSIFDGHWREIDDGLPELASPKARPPMVDQWDIFADFIEQALEQDMRGEDHENVIQSLRHLRGEHR